MYDKIFKVSVLRVSENIEEFNIIADTIEQAKIKAIELAKNHKWDMDADYIIDSIEEEKENI